MGKTGGRVANGAPITNSSSGSAAVSTQDNQPSEAEPPDIIAAEKPVHPHTLSARAVSEQLRTHIDYGLSSEEAATRLIREGPNSITTTKGISLWTIFFAQTANALTAILIAVTALSFAIGDYIERSEEHTSELQSHS